MKTEIYLTQVPLLSIYLVCTIPSIEVLQYHTVDSILLSIVIVVMIEILWATAWLA